MSEESEVLAAFQQADSPEQLQAEPSVPETPATPTEPPPTPAATPTEPRNPLNLSDDDLIEVAKGVQKKWSEIRQTQHLLPADYTRKTQALAAERREWEASRSQWEQQRTQHEQELQAFVNRIQQERLAEQAVMRDPRALEARWLALQAVQQAQGQPPVPGQGPGQPIPGTPYAPQNQGPTPPAFDPRQFQAYADQLVNQRFAEYQQKQDLERVNFERANTLQSHMSKVLDANPALRAFPNVENALYDQVSLMVEKGKTTVEEAQGMIDLLVQQAAEGLNSHYTQVKKVDAVAQAQLRNGIEPPGGASIPVTPKKYNPKLGMEDPDLERDAIAAFIRGVSS